MTPNPVNVQQFVDDAKATIQDPKAFYSSMPLTGGFNEPVMRAVLFGLITGGLGFLLAFVSFGGGGFGSRIFTAITLLIAYPICAVIGVFVGGVVIMVFSAIAGGSSDYEGATRVAASTVFLIPIQAVASFLTSINAYLGSAVSVAISLFAIYLLFNALLYALKANEKPSKIICGVFALLAVIGVFSTAVAMSNANRAIQETQEMLDQLGE